MRNARRKKIPAVNGLWLWQDLEGTQSARPLLSSDSAWADFYPGERTDAPYDFEAWQAMLNEAGATFSDGLFSGRLGCLTSQTGDTWAYRDILESWETRWFAPLRRALDSKGRLKSLTIVTDGENGGSLRIKPHSKRAFWKRKRKFNGLLVRPSENQVPGRPKGRLKLFQTAFFNHIRLLLRRFDGVWSGLIRISTRRFCARPSGVALDATGWREP